MSEAPTVGGAAFTQAEAPALLRTVDYAKEQLGDRQAQRRGVALEMAVRTHRAGIDSADHILQSARKFLAFLEGTEAT